MSRHHPITASSDPSLQSKSRSAWEIIRRVAPYLRPYRWMALANLGFAILSLGFAFAYPKLTQQIIDVVIADRRSDLLMPMIAALIGAFALREVFNGLRIWVNNRFEQNVIFDMRRDLYARLQRLPVSFYDARASGDLMTRVIEDVNSVERVLIDGTEQGTIAILSIAGVLIFLFSANPMLAAIALIPMPLLVIGAMLYTLTAHKRYRAQRQASGAMNALLMDSLQGIRQIKTFGRQDHEDQRFAAKADDLRKGTLQVMSAWSKYSPSMAFASSLGIGCVLWAGGREVIAGSMKVGELVQFVLYLGLFYEPVGRLHGLNQMLQAARAGGERVFDIFDATPERNDRPATLRTPVRGDVVYEDVAFGYGPDRQTLRGVRLHGRPGETIALVGPTGAGKSTLVNLLPAFYESTGGRITLDGQDIRDISLDSLRSHISVVSQEPFLFNGTVRENILYGKLDASEAEMTAAAQAANCHDFISRLPEGYESRVGERGVKLSVGEKQRVSIARALLKNAPILILDEATASVDTATERQIQEALSRLMKGRTCFIIAHRLSTIRDAHQILVLNKGEIQERGTHDELVARDGLYAKLARIQNTTFIEEGFEKILN